MESFVFNFADAKTRKAFVDRCIRDYGIDPSSLYVSESAHFVILENLNSGILQRLRTESGVASVFEDARLEPFL